MKSPLLYVQLTTAKNELKETLKKPAKLILSLFLVFLIAGNFILAGFSSVGDETRDPCEIAAMALALYTFMAVTVMSSGFTKSAAMFTMADVNLIFTSPVSKAGVFVYGAVKQMRSSFVLGFFILLQYSWLRDSYAIDVTVIISAFFFYSLTLFAANLLSMAVYILTSARENVRKMIRIGMWTVYGAAAVYMAAGAIAGSGGIVERIMGTVTPLFLLLVPISGWGALGVWGTISSEPLFIIMASAAFAALIIAAFAAVIRSGTDYYEDVISGAETLQTIEQDRKDGNIAENVPKNVKLGKNGIGKGFGADTLFYKHMVENRRARTKYISTAGIFTVLSGWIFGVLMRDGGIIFVFVFTTYIQIFTMLMGRFNKELTKPYIYLIPEPPFKKMLWASLETLITTAVEALLLYVPLAFVASDSAFITVTFIFGRISFGMISVAVNVFVGKMWSGTVPKALESLLYFSFYLIFAAPGVLLGFLIPPIFGSAEIFSGFSVLIMSVVNACAAAAVMYFSRDVLVCPEFGDK